MDQRQQNLQGILKFAVEAGSHGSNQNVSSQPTRELSSGDRTWLSEAIGGISGGGVNIIAEIKKSLDEISEYLNKESPSDKETEDILIMLENISEWCENLDVAQDVEKIKGFDVALRCLTHKDPEIRWRGAELLASSAQNNEYCQNALLKNNALNILMKMVDDSKQDAQVRVKSFYAVSCIVRGNADNLKHFENFDGFSMVIRSLQSGVNKLELKAVFFLRALCLEDTKIIETLTKHGIDEQFVTMLKNFSEKSLQDSDMSLLEQVLSTLLSLIQSSNQCITTCLEARFQFSSVLKKLKNELTNNFKDFEESIRYTKEIYKICYESSDNEMER